MVPDYYDYVVTFRNSRARYQSHYYHLYSTAVSYAKKVHRQSLLTTPATTSSNNNKTNNTAPRQPEQHPVYSFLSKIFFSSSSSSSSTSTSAMATTRHRHHQQQQQEQEQQQQQIRRRRQHWQERQQHQELSHHERGSKKKIRSREEADDDAVLSSRRSTTNKDAMRDAAPKETMEDATENEHGATTFHGDQSGQDQYNLTIRDSKGVFHRLGNYTHWILGQPDNYNMRMICGTRCRDVPKYRLTQDLFEYTMLRLWYNFTHILFVEDMDNSFRRFATAYGWTIPSSTATIKNATTTVATIPSSDTKKAKKKKQQFLSSLSNSSWDPYMSVLDDALYEFAKRKYYYNTTASTTNHSPDVFDAAIPSNSSSNSSNGGLPISFISSSSSLSLYPSLPSAVSGSFANQKLVDEYFCDGSKRNCTNACCGVCSVW